MPDKQNTHIIAIYMLRSCFKLASKCFQLAFNFEIAFTLLLTSRPKADPSDISAQVALAAIIRTDTPMQPQSPTTPPMEVSVWASARVDIRTLRSWASLLRFHANTSVGRVIENLENQLQKLRSTQEECLEVAAELDQLADATLAQQRAEPR